MPDSIYQILMKIETAILITDARDNSVLFVNSTASDLTGLPSGYPDDQCFFTFSSRRYDDDGREIIELQKEDGEIATLLKTVNPVQFRGCESLLSILADISGLEESEKEREASFRKLEDSRKMLLGIMEDTELSYRKTKELSEKIRHDEEFLKQALSMADLGVCELEPVSKKLDFNQWFYKMGGYEDNEFSSTIPEFIKRIHREDRKTVNNIIGDILNGRIEESSLGFRFRKKDGDFLWLSGKIVKTDPIYEGLNDRYMGVFSDITRAKKKEQALIMLNEMQRFLLKQVPLERKFTRISETIFNIEDLEMAAIWLYQPRHACEEGCILMQNDPSAARCRESDQCFHLAACSCGEKYDRNLLDRIPGSSFGLDMALSGPKKLFTLPIDRGDIHLGNRENLELTGYRINDQNGNITGILAIFSLTPLDEDMRFYIETTGRLTSQVQINDKTTRELHEALNLSERANNLMEGREKRIRRIKEEINNLSRQMGKDEIYAGNLLNDFTGEEEKISPEESRLNALSLAEDAEIARREVLEINEQLSIIKQAVNSSSDAIAISTHSGDFSYINNAFSEILGFSIDRITLLSIDLLFENSSVLEEIFNTVSRGEIWQGRTNLFKSDNSLIPVYLRTSLFNDERDNPVGLIWTMTDITDQIKSEQKIRDYTVMIEEDLERKKQMLKKATLLQKSFIQKTLPVAVDLVLKALFLPCENLGGDFFRIERNHHENKVIIIVGDCTDHGLKASMDASLLSSLIDPKKNLLYQLETDRFLGEISREFSVIADDDQFPTMLVMVIDEFSGEATYSNANGEMPLLYREGEILELEKTFGMHIGYFDDPVYGKNSFHLSDGDHLLFFSDAVPEMKTGRENERLGYEGLKKVMMEAGDFESMIRRIEDINGGFPLEDDLTLLALHYQKPVRKNYLLKTLDQLPGLLSEVRLYMEERDFSEKEQGRTEIILREIFLNAVQHGNKHDPDKTVSIELTIGCDSWEICLEDEGDGFDRQGVPDPVVNIEEIMKRDIEKEYTRGRGIAIIEQFADTVIYSRKGNRVVLRMEKSGNNVLTG